MANRHKVKKLYTSHFTPHKTGTERVTINYYII